MLSRTQSLENAVVFGHNLCRYIFGGCGEGGRLNDLWKLDTKVRGHGARILCRIILRNFILLPSLIA